MRSIFFNLRAGVGQHEREALMQRLGRVKGVHKVAGLRPDAKNIAVQRMCYAQVTDDADVNSVKELIVTLPEVESADLPAERGLLGS